MAKKTSGKSGDLKKGRYAALHRYMCGITVTCVMVVIAVSFSSGESTLWVLVKASGVFVALVFAEKAIIKVWAACEEVQAESSLPAPGRDK